MARDSVTGGVREQPLFSQTAFLWEGSPKPLLAAHAAAGHILFSWNEKRMQKNQKGIILTRQAKPSREGQVLTAVRVASFLTRGNRQRLAACFLALLLFSHSGSFFFIQ